MCKVCEEDSTNACEHGGWFYVRNGMHLTSNDIFIGLEMADCQKGEDGAEKDRNLHLQLEAVQTTKVLAIVT